MQTRLPTLRVNVGSCQTRLKTVENRDLGELHAHRRHGLAGVTVRVQLEVASSRKGGALPLLPPHDERCQRVKGGRGFQPRAHDLLAHQLHSKYAGCTHKQTGARAKSYEVHLLRSQRVFYGSRNSCNYMPILFESKKPDDGEVWIHTKTGKKRNSI